MNFDDFPLFYSDGFSVVLYECTWRTQLTSLSRRILNLALCYLKTNNMILATDVHYTNSTAIVSGILFEQWSAEKSKHEYTCKLEGIAPYESGSFYKRELPCILALLEKHDLSVDYIVIDGYVYLDKDLRPGLGKYLFDALGGTASVVGVAKNPFPGISDEHKILRGESKNPLYVTTTGELADAKRNIESMHGKFRLPQLLKRADLLCRSEA